MRQPRTVKLPEGQHVVFNGTLEENIDLAAALGIIGAKWTLADSAIAMLFTSMAQTDARLGTYVLDKLRDFNKKTDVIMFAARLKIRDVALRDRLKACLDSLQEVGKTRGNLMHMRWGTCAAYPGALVGQRKTWPERTVQLYDIEWFIELIQEMNDRNQAFSELNLEILRTLGLVPRLEVSDVGPEGTARQGPNNIDKSP